MLIRLDHVAHLAALNARVEPMWTRFERCAPTHSGRVLYEKGRVVDRALLFIFFLLFDDYVTLVDVVAELNSGRDDLLVLHRDVTCGAEHGRILFALTSTVVVGWDGGASLRTVGVEHALRDRGLLRLSRQVLVAACQRNFLNLFFPISVLFALDAVFCLFNICCLCRLRGWLLFLIFHY